MNEKLVCDYCEEESDYVPIIKKPEFFVYENRKQPLGNITERQDFICLDCLRNEMEHLKEY